MARPPRELPSTVRQRGQPLCNFEEGNGLPDLTTLRPISGPILLFVIKTSSPPDSFPDTDILPVAICPAIRLLPSGSE
jgi:hypothetical protein